MRTALALIVVWRVRGSDALFRIGGDEFVLILGDAKASSALKVANDVRQLIREQAPQELPDFAISFGICCVDDSLSADDWLERADEALYEAKKLGGDAARMATLIMERRASFSRLLAALLRPSWLLGESIFIQPRRHIRTLGNR